MPNPWFRMYTDFLEDPKLLALAFEDQRHFIGVLALKSSGTLDQDCSPELRDRLVAQRLWIDHSAIGEVKRRLIEARLINEDWQPIAWDKRQFVSDRDPTAAERARRYRQKKKDKTASRVTSRNENGAVTPLDTDTDTDTKENTRSSAAAPDRFADFWDVYPKKVKKQEAKKKWKARKLDQKADEIIADVKARQTKDGRWLEGFVPDPTTYINGSRWEDALEAPRRNGSSKPDWAQIPRSDDDLWPWAKQHGYPNPGSLNYYQYRQTLQRAVEQRLNQ